MSDAPPRVKVSLACLQGRHTDECGHLEPTRAPAPAAAHNHTWQRMADPHKLYHGPAYVCDGPLSGGCGATMDNDRVYPFGEAPAASLVDAVSDGLEPAGVQLTLDVELTPEERRQVIAGHLVLDPAAILEAVRLIVQRRLEAAGTVTA